MREYYSNHLSLATDRHGTSIEWRQTNIPDKKEFYDWSPFPNGAKYFEPSQKEFLVKFRVQKIKELLETLREEEVAVVDGIETFKYGKFVHIMDLEGNRIEPWEPIADMFDQMTGAVRT